MKIKTPNMRLLGLSYLGNAGTQNAGKEGSSKYTYLCLMKNIMG